MPVAVMAVPNTMGAFTALVLVGISKRGRGDQGDRTSEEKTFQHWHDLTCSCTAIMSYAA
jgi:hypothetical protein